VALWVDIRAVRCAHHVYDHGTSERSSSVVVVSVSESA